MSPEREDLELDVSLDASTAVPISIDELSSKSLIRAALISEGASGRWEIALRLVDDDEIQKLHREFMGLDTPTDIMTFPYGIDDYAKGAMAQGGDIVISLDTALSHAEDEGWTLADEIRFLVLHGTLHLLGWSDHSPLDRQVMLDRQRELLTAWSDLNVNQEGNR